MGNQRIWKVGTTALLLGALLLTPARAAFADTTGHWAQAAIDKWSGEYSIIQGYEDGRFRPDQPVTRGAMAGIIDRVMHYQKRSPAGTFSDITGNTWESAVLKLHAAGVMLGTEGRANVTSTINRQEAMVMMARAFGIQESDQPLPYDDADTVGNFARGYLSALHQGGYITDVWGNNFRPREYITRAEIVNLANNLTSTLFQKSGTYSQNVEGDLLVNANDVLLQNMTISGDLIIAPGVTTPVTLENTSIQGSLRNFSGITPLVSGGTTEKPTNPTPPPTNPTTPPVSGPLSPSDVYVPGVTTGENITYSGKKIPVYRDAEPLRVYDGDFSWGGPKGDRLVYNGGAFNTRFGIDVSSYQNRASANNTIDWNAVRADGVDFAMVRIGLRGTSTGKILADTYYGQNIDGAMAAGIDTGVYFFAQAITVEEAIEEADFVIEQLKGHQISGPVAYDWEMHDSSYRVYGTTPEMATACAVAFCKRIEEAGYKAMVYAGQYVSYMKYDLGALAPYAYWYPEYKSASSQKLYPTHFYQMDIWQFSSSCSINGIGGRVDANIQFLPR